MSSVVLAILETDSGMDDLECSRDEMVVAGLLKHEMHVGWPHGMAAEFYEQLPDRAIVGDGVRHGHDGLEPKDTLVVASHHTSAIWPVTIGVLDVVVS